jgi:hypothetical protein
MSCRHLAHADSCISQTAAINNRSGLQTLAWKKNFAERLQCSQVDTAMDADRTTCGQVLQIYNVQPGKCLCFWLFNNAASTATVT